MSQRLILCPAQPFDLPAIMTIERSAFIPPIQEKRRVFDERLQLFPQGFFVLADAGEEAVRKHGAAVTAGYFCSELWQALPTLTADDGTELLSAPSPQATAPDGSAMPRVLPKHEKTLAQQFALGHQMRRTHRRDGSVLYVSSFALATPYRGQGLGEPFFRTALAALCGAHSQIRRVVLIASEEWRGARRIYESAGFVPRLALADFFPSLHKKRADAIVMTADADRFRTAALVTNGNGAVMVRGRKP